MSGILSQIAGRVDLAASLLFGGGEVVLGDFVFEEMEIPESIPWGGQQQTTVHKFPGGARVIDAMGRDDMPLAWSGIFINDPEGRARQLNEYRISGEAIPLSWRDFSFTVVVTDFQCETRAFHSPYRITCTVLRDNAADQQEGEPSILQQIGADVNSALGFNVAATVTDALNTVQKAASGLTVLIGGSAAAVGLQQAVGVAQGLNAVANTAADSRIASSVLATVTDPSRAVTALNDLTDASGLGAAGQAAAGFIGRTLINATQGAH